MCPLLQSKLCLGNRTQNCLEVGSLFDSICLHVQTLLPGGALELTLACKNTVGESSGLHSSSKLKLLKQIFTQCLWEKLNLQITETGHNKICSRGNWLPVLLMSSYIIFSRSLLLLAVQRFSCRIQKF